MKRKYNLICDGGTDDKCCGACESFENEIFDGYGTCVNDEQESVEVYCADVCDLFKERKEGKE